MTIRSIIDYQNAAQLFDRRRKNKIGDRIKLYNNTWLERLGPDADGKEVFGIILHATCVIKIFDGNYYQLFTDGFRTVTTKDRLNTYSPASIWQKKGEWKVGYTNPVGFPADGDDFYDGIIVDRHGSIVKQADGA